MHVQNLILLSLLFLVFSFLYSAVGHGGASGYIAAMVFVGLSPMESRSVALCLNIIVSAIAFWKFYKNGFFNLKLFLFFALTSIPMAYLGGRLPVQDTFLKKIIGLVLMLSAVLFFFKREGYSAMKVKEFNRGLALLLGAILGFISGITGVGGGIFLSPVLLALKWEQPKSISGISAAFIFVNSFSGLLGNAPDLGNWFVPLIVFIPLVITGGYFGSRYGATCKKNQVLIAFLSLVLLLAGIKLSM